MEQPITHASYLGYLSENRLMGTRCLDCQQIYLPPRAICRRCHSERLEWLEMPGRGRLAAFTRIAVGQSRMAEAGYSRENPYWSGVVELENGARISAQIMALGVRDR